MAFMRRRLWKLFDGRQQSDIRVILGGQAEVSGATVTNTNRYNQPHPNQNDLLDFVWRLHRDAFSNKRLRSMIIETPVTILKYRSWTKFIDSGMLGIWAKQMLRKDVLADLSPPARLAYVMADMAVVLNAASHEDTEDGMFTDRHIGVSKEDEDTLCQLLDTMIDAVFVKRFGSKFKHVSLATEALGYYSDILHSKPNLKDIWASIIHDWITSGRLFDDLSPFLKDLDPYPIGLTSISGFMRGMARLNYKPPDSELRLLALASQKRLLKPGDAKFVPASRLVDCARSWHAWRLDPDTSCDQWWSAWFTAYADFLERPGDEGKNRAATIGLIQTALWMANDFGKADAFEPVSGVTERELSKLADSDGLSRTKANALFRACAALNERTVDGRVLFSDKVLANLISIAKGS